MSGDGEPFECFEGAHPSKAPDADAVVERARKGEAPGVAMGRGRVSAASERFRRMDAASPCAFNDIRVAVPEMMRPAPATLPSA